MSTPSFEGFTRPQANFYRLPLTWFDTLRALREQHERRRIVALVRLTEYVIKWTWGQGNFDGGVRLTLDELRNGKVSSRVDGERVRLDRGTGLPHKTLLPTLDDALNFGLLTRTTLTDDRARVKSFYAAAQAPDDPELAQAPGVPFIGFTRPQTNYFILPKLWTDLTAGVASETLILSVEYLFRHCWNWGREDEVHWLTVDEIANGRQLRNSNNAQPTRYDRGIGYSERKVRDALDEAVTREWIVWRTNYSYDDLRSRTEFTLRREGWAVGEHPSPPLPGISDEMLQESLARHRALSAAKNDGSSPLILVPEGPKVTAEGPKVTPEGPKVTADGLKVTAEGPIFQPSEGPKVTADGLKVTAEGPKVTADGPKVTIDQLYQPNIPTKETNLDAPTPPSSSRARAAEEEVSSSTPVLGGGGASPAISESEQPVIEAASPKEPDLAPAPAPTPATTSTGYTTGGLQPAPERSPRVRYSFSAPSHGPRLMIDAPAWPEAWLHDAPLHPVYVLVGDPDSTDPMAILSLQDAAELLWRGLPRDWIVWDPDWLDCDEIPEDSEEWSEDARRRETTVDDLVAIMETNSERWGHWDLPTALRQHGLAPERAQELLSQHGRTLVGAWLTDLRGDPSVHSVPAVLITNLRKGLTPPSLIRTRKQYGIFDGTS